MPHDNQSLESVLEATYDSVHADPQLMEIAEQYSDRHGICSAAILTVIDDERAAMLTNYLHDRVKDKTVVEIGSGIGFLAVHLSSVAKRVIAIEANPLWTSVWVAFLHSHKPKNVTWIFGAADEVAGMIRGDVSLFCTHSDHEGMAAVASQFAPEVIDVYRELLTEE